MLRKFCARIIHHRTLHAGINSFGLCAKGECLYPVAGPRYLDSPRFLAAHGGWKGVVWVSPEIAEMMGDALPEHVQVGPRVE